MTAYNFDLKPASSLLSLNRQKIKEEWYKKCAAARQRRKATNRNFSKKLRSSATLIEP